MVDSYSQLSADIERVQQISMVPTMLEVICRATGMGFAAIARVTQDRWIACSVRDEINFGLQPGGELKIETTICNEIRDTRKAVIIDHVAQDEHYCKHHTPLMYGFQSYISIPIILKNGEFFGTLCSIDPRPAQLSNTKIIGMFTLFAELISFHLQSLELMERSHTTLHALNRKLSDTADDNRQYEFISNHNLQEPIRKIRIFTEMLVEATEKKDNARSKDLALRINSSAQKVSMMISDLSTLAQLDSSNASFGSVDLNKIITDVSQQLKSDIREKQAIIDITTLPHIKAIHLQMEQLFFHLISNAIKFSRNNVSPLIKISATKLTAEEAKGFGLGSISQKYLEVRVEDNGIGIEKIRLEKIFDIFTQVNHDQAQTRFGVGLTYCRKIVRNHGGSIAVHSEPGVGTAFSIIFPRN